MIETTANIDILTYKKIRSAAKEHNLKIRHIIHVLFRRMLADLPLRSRAFSRIKYQERRPDRNWKIMKLGLSLAVYESCLDMRKLHKMSVSYILEIAVGLYLEKAVRELQGEVLDVRENPDNYSDCYTLIHITTPETSFYTAFHLPPPPDLLKLFEKYR